MARQTTILGLAALDRKLKRLPAVARETIRTAMAKAADETTAMMRSLVPERTGDLRESIGWTWGAAPKGSLVVSTLKGAGVGGDLTITIYSGNSEEYYARWVEFGTKKMPAQPYFFVSWRANRRKARNKVRGAVRKAARQVASQ